LTDAGSQDAAGHQEDVIARPANADLVSILADKRLPGVL
jgi:hypothetical protein